MQSVLKNEAQMGNPHWVLRGNSKKWYQNTPGGKYPLKSTADEHKTYENDNKRFGEVRDKRKRQ